MAEDPEHGAENKTIMQGWIDKYQPLCQAAANQLQPVWSLPRVKPATYIDAFAAAENRFQQITNELGLG